MAQSSITDLQTACTPGFSEVHRLQCGHHIKAEGAMPCGSNCHNISTDTWTGYFWICEACMLDRFIDTVLEALQPAFLALYLTQKWQAADEEKRHRMRRRVIRQWGAGERYGAWREDEVVEARRSGGMECERIDFDDLVDDLGDLFKDDMAIEDVEADDASSEEDLPSRQASAPTSTVDIVPQLEPLYVSQACNTFEGMALTRDEEMENT